MIELDRILKKFELIDTDTYCLAEVVKVEGSSYRLPGAKMLISNSGSFCGNVSGGCLEGDVLKKAKTSINNKIKIIKTYDTSDDKNNSITRNLGCNGIVDILFEPIDSDSILLKQIQIAQKNDSVLAIATIIESDNENISVGSRFILNSSEKFFSEIDDDQINNKVQSLLQNKISENKNSIEKIDISNQEYSLFYEIIPPKVQLILFGSGFDVKPIIILAKNLGWKVIVTSDSYSITMPEEFFPADVIEYIDRDEIEENIKITENTYCILISHNYKYDKKVLSTILKSETDYIGILGPQKRFNMMKTELLAAFDFVESDFDKVYSPIGLDIGAENQDEIALSIVSEILAIIRKKNGLSLKYKKGNIHN